MLDRYLNTFAPVGRNDFQRARLTLFIALACLVCVPIYSAFYLFVGFQTGAVLVVAAGVAFCIPPFLLRGSSSVRPAANTLAASTFAVIAGLVWTSGWIDSPVNAWLVLPPLLALLLAGRKSAWFWTGVTIVHIAALWTLDARGVEAPVGYDPSWDALMQFILFAGIVVMIVVIGLMFERGKENAVEAAQAAADNAQQLADQVTAIVQQLEAEQQATAASQRQVVAEQTFLREHVQHLVRATERLASGDFTATRAPRAFDADDVNADTVQAVQQLYAGLDAIGQALGHTLQQVRNAVTATASTAADIDAATRDLARGADTQSVQTHEMAEAIQALAATAQDNARNAAQADEVAQANKSEAQHGGQTVNETRDKIRAVSQVVSASAGTVQKLGASSKEIGEIVATINDIADQTNLLALNAAIEAARAGEQGRGFAVVADEVRKLAERTAQATKQIAAMITTIQTETEAAVQAMQRGQAEVEQGVKLAEQAGDNLGRIIHGADASVDRIVQIAAASEEQSATTTQLSRTVSTVATISQGTIDGLEHVTALAATIQTATDELDALLRRFQTETPTGGSLRRAA
ncbi:MAG: methyl-accepting chemotaxis protein [Bacteroidota bacterium]